MNVYKIIDNLHENKFYIVKIDGVFFMISNEFKDYVYITTDKNEFEAMFQYEQDDPINSNLYIDLINKFLICENFYLKKKVIGAFQFTDNNFYKLDFFIKPTFDVENFINFVQDRIDTKKNNRKESLTEEKKDKLRKLFPNLGEII